MAEGVGFEPTVTLSATTAFEAAPFVRSGNLPFPILPFGEATTINRLLRLLPVAALLFRSGVIWRKHRLRFCSTSFVNYSNRCSRDYD